MQTRRRTLRTLGVGVLIVAAMLAINARYPALLDRIELQLFDLRLKAQHRPKPAGIVAIAAIDDASLKQLGEWPWPRAVTARLVAALNDYHVRAIGFDIVFSEPDAYDRERNEILARLSAQNISGALSSLTVGPSNDATLATAVHAEGMVILGFPFESHNLRRNNQRYTGKGFVGTILSPAPMEYGIVRCASGAHPDLPTAFAYLPDVRSIREAARGLAYFDVTSDSDAAIRSQMMVIRFNDHYYLPLPLALLSVAAGNPFVSLTLDDYGVATVSIAGQDVPVDDVGQMLINYRGPGHTFPTYSAADIIGHHVAPRDLAGKIVLVGVTARGLGDRVATPLDADAPGVEVHANVIDNLIVGDFIYRSRVNELLSRSAAFVLGLAVCLVFAFLTERASAIVSAFLVTGYLLLAHLTWAHSGLVLNVVFPLLTLGVTYAGLAGYRYATEGAEKRYLRSAFEHYLHPKVIELILERPDTVKLGGEIRHLSILFADIVNYTARAERENPEDLVALLNTYLTRMTDLIMESGGVVDKIRGDGIMAFWGAPVDVSNPSRLAIDCALDMLDELHSLRGRDSRFADIDIGIGIATGQAVVGNCGGERRFDYSAIGDTVNLASRFESLTRQVKAHLLVAKETYTEADGSYVAREVGLVRVKGKSQAVAMVEVIGRQGPEADGFYGRFEAALNMLRNGSAAEGHMVLKQLGEERPDDKVVRMYLERLKSGSLAPGELVFDFEVK